MTSPAGLRLHVLGPVVVEGPGGRLELGSRRHREVLAALAVDAGLVVPAEVVTARLWGDDASASPTTLHALVSRLRGRLREVTPEHVVVTEPPGYRLALDACEVDAVALGRRLVEARRLLAEGDLHGAHDSASTALALWRGRPYADVRGHFAEVEAARLEEQRWACHELLAEADLALGRHERLLDVLPGVVAEQPLRESLQGALMLALYRSGRQAEALASYERARALLADELGIDPGPDLQRLWTRMLQQDPELAPPATPTTPSAPTSPTSPTSPSPTPVPEVRTGPLLVGRDRELDALAGLLDTGGIACVVGEPGIGKTRLVDALVERAASSATPPLVAVGACWEGGGGAALWPWEQAVGALVDGVGLDVAREAAGRAPGAGSLLTLLAPALGADGTEPARDPDPDRARLRLFDAVARFLDEVAARRPVLVVLEDVHDADEESVALLRYLARSRRAGPTGRAGRVTVVTTTRDVEGAGPAAEVQAVVGRAGGLVLTLPGLDEDGVGRLVEHHLGSALRAGVAASLRERTDGNPFYLVELTRLLGQERGDHGRADVPVPRSVTAVVESRLRGQSVADREVLGAAALVGRDVDLDLLAVVLGRRVGELGAALDRAAAAGLLVPGRDPGVQRFSHALVREVLEGTVGPVRRATWHAQVAEALIARHGDDAAAGSHAARIAHHLLHAGAVGDAAATVRFTLLAAARAERRVALLDAERLLGAALDVVPRLAPAVGEPLELEVRTRLGALLAQRLGYDHPAVAEQRRRAIDLARRTGSHGPLLGALWGLWGAALVAGHLAEAEALVGDIARAAEATGDPWVAVAEAQAIGQVRLLQGRFAEARAALERGVALVDDLPPAPLETFVQEPAASLRGWLVVVLTLCEAPETGATVRAVRRVLDRVDHAYTTVYVELLLAWCAVWRDDPEEARSAGDLAAATARRAGFEQFAAFATLPSAWARGRDDDPGALGIALEESAAVCAQYVEPGHHMLGTVMSSVHADLLLQAGRAGDALAVTERAVATATTSGERFVLADLHRLRAACLAALGRAGESDVALAEAVAVAREQGAALLERRASDVQASTATVVDGPHAGP